MVGEDNLSFKYLLSSPKGNQGCSILTLFRAYSTVFMGGISSPVSEFQGFIFTVLKAQNPPVKGSRGGAIRQPLSGGVNLRMSTLTPGNINS